MPTFTALTTLPGKAPAEALGLALEDIDPQPTGVGVFEVEDGSGLWEVGAYFTEEPDDIALDILAAAHGAKPFAISELPETDWVAHVRRELHPVEAGRFFVYGSHDADKLPSDRIGLLIEAAMAFGTGHHGTTQGCLEAFDALLMGRNQPNRVADIGCGTAVLAIAAAKVLGQRVIASDIDTTAVETAAANADANGVGTLIHSVEAAGFDHADIQAAAPYDLVFANILKGPLVELAPDMGRYVGVGGHIILSGLLITQAEDILAAYEAQGFKPVARRELGEWATLTMQR